MCFELTSLYEYGAHGHFKDADPELCGCKGTGWFLSQVDTWHFCSTHGDPNGPHPEDPTLSDEERAQAALYRAQLPGVGVLIGFFGGFAPEDDIPF